MNNVIWLLVAVVAGWMVQLYLTYKQSMAFNRQVLALRRQGTVSVGVAGKRYRGGRAYVALAIDEQQRVRDALTLSGWTTFARARSLAPLTGLSTRRITTDRAVPGVSKQQHEAARQAIDLARRAAHEQPQTRVPVEPTADV